MLVLLFHTFGSKALGKQAASHSRSGIRFSIDPPLWLDAVATAAASAASLLIDLLGPPPSLPHSAVKGQGSLTPCWTNCLHTYALTCFLVSEKNKVLQKSTFYYWRSTQIH